MQNKKTVLSNAYTIKYNHTRYSFDPEQKRRVHMTPEQTSDFYAEHYGKMFFPSLVAYMSNGPILAIVLAKQSAIAYWRQLIGPTNTQKARDQAPERYLDLNCNKFKLF